MLNLKKAVTDYLKFSAGTTLAGGFLGGAVGVTCAPTVVLHAMEYSKSETALGRLTDGMIEAGKTVGRCAGYGFFKGSKPITYVPCEIYKHISQNCEDSSVSRYNS